MNEFSVMLRITGDRGGPVAATVALDGGRLVVQVGDVEVGAWPLRDVRMVESRTGVDMSIGDDAFTLDLSDPTPLLDSVRTARSVGAPARPSRRGARTRRAGERLRRLGRRLRAVLSVPVLASSATLAGLATAAVLWPLVVGPVGLLVGLILVTGGYLAHTEPSVALRIPAGLPAGSLMIAGTTVVVAGAGVTLLG